MASALPDTGPVAVAAASIAYNPSLADAPSDRPATNAAGCQQHTLGYGLIICVRGDREGKTRAMLIGASHANMWYPAVNRISRNRDWRLLTALKGNCRIDLESPFNASCRAWLRDLMARIERNPPDVILTTGTVTTKTGEHVPPGYVDIWKRLNRLGIPVVLIRDTPRATFDRVRCLRDHPARPSRCAIPRHPALDTVNPLEQMALPGNVILVDMSDVVCGATTCPAVSGSIVMYRDNHHLTATYARSIAGALAAQVPSNPRMAVGTANGATR